jgi:hypothetical protein
MIGSWGHEFSLVLLPGNVGQHSLRKTRYRKALGEGEMQNRLVLQECMACLYSPSRYAIRRNL